MKPVDILCTSDLHGMLDGLREIVSRTNPNMLAIAGDIQPARIDIDPARWFKQEFFPFVESLGIPVVATPGNHDFYLQRLLDDNEWAKTPQNWHLLCDEETSIEGLRIYGTPWVPWINGMWAFERNESSLPYYFAGIPEGLDLLITHSPPFFEEHEIDVSLEWAENRRRHFGSPSLTKEILEKAPQYVVCGHIHSGLHMGVTVKAADGRKDINIFNVSRVNERYQVYYTPALVSILPKVIV